MTLGCFSPILVCMTASKEILIRRANDFCQRHKIQPPTLAKRIVNDGKFFDRLNDGGDCTTETYDRFIAYFDSDGKTLSG